jgi:hypothetical protein
MKRFTAFGLCLVAAFALSMLAAASAFAKTEHGESVVRSSGGAAHLGTKEGSITSTANHGTGNLTGPTGGTARSVFEGVEFAAVGAKCHSAGKPEGTVETFLLSEGTGWIKKAAPQEAGVDFKPASGSFLAEFVCGPGTVKVHGSVIGHVTPLNTAGLETKLNLVSNGTGKANSPESFEGGSKDILETNLNGVEIGESLQEQLNVSVVNHGNSSVCKVKKGVEKCKPVPSGEFYTLNGTPEFGRCDKQAGGTFSDTSCTNKVTKKGKYAFVPLPG